jgi:hypothetical protein
VLGAAPHLGDELYHSEFLDVGDRSGWSWSATGIATGGELGDALVKGARKTHKDTTTSVTVGRRRP